LWLPQSFRPQERFVNVVGNGKSFSMYPTGGKGNLFGYFVMSAPPDANDPVEQRIENLKEHFNDMDYLVPEVLHHLPNDPNSIYHHDHEQVDVDEWYTGRVCLLGDAAHAISPVLGMGAPLALEDAYVLAEEIDTSDTIQEALVTYEDRRHERVRRVQRRSNVVDSVIGTELPHWLYTIRNTAMRFFAERIYCSFQRKNQAESAIDLM
ncbi:MAG: FAD-dependent oxidoreductase, partial [Halobacteriaceae archaeon]